MPTMHHSSDVSGTLTKGYDAVFEGDATHFVVTITISARQPVLARFSSPANRVEIEDFLQLEDWQAQEALISVDDALSHFLSQPALTNQPLKLV